VIDTPTGDFLELYDWYTNRRFFRALWLIQQQEIF